MKKSILKLFFVSTVILCAVFVSIGFAQLTDELSVGGTIVVEEQKGGLVADEARQLGVTGAVGNTRVQNFDNQINVLKVFGDQTAGFRHMSREPLNLCRGHSCFPFFFVISRRDQRRRWGSGGRSRGRARGARPQIR